MNQAHNATQEYGFESAAAVEFPQTVIVENTNVCNLRCIHCPQGQGWPDSPGWHAHYLEWDLYAKLIDEIAENKVFLVRFAPEGEALVHPRFLDQIAYAKARGVGTLDLTTNGLNLDNQAIEDGVRLPGKTILDRLLDHGVDIIDISLDAHSRAAYDKIRVGSNYHRVLSNLHRLLYMREQKGARTKVMVSIVDQPESHGEVQRFVDYWTPLVDRVIVRGYQSLLGLVPGKSSDVLEPAQQAGRWPCSQFWRRVTVSADGAVRFCVVDWDHKSNVGHLRTHTIKELWRSAEYERMRRAHLEGRYADAHHLCGPCRDWQGMRWDWGFEVAVNAVTGREPAPAAPPPIGRIPIKAIRPAGNKQPV
jgi:MoaA/NifB/PqqE/SkfB family radical SAM enzyme